MAENVPKKEKKKHSRKCTQRKSLSDMTREKVEKMTTEDEVDGWKLIRTIPEGIRVFEKEGKYRVGVTRKGSLVPMMKVLPKNDREGA